MKEKVYASPYGKNRIEGLCIARSDNVRYISSFTGEDSSLPVTKDKNYFLTDPR